MHTLSKLRPISSNEFSGSARRSWSILLFFLALGCLILLWRPIVLIPFRVPKDWNEGYYAILQMRAFSVDGLYPSADGLLVNAYPPIFYLISGALGDLVGDHIVAGRITALLGLLVVSIVIGITTSHLAQSRHIGVFCALLFIGFIAVYSPGYVAMNDPQWMGQAIMAIGLLVFVRFGDLRWGFAVVASIFVIGGLTKHNLVALPLAITVALALEDRRRFFQWTFLGLSLLVVALACLYSVYGANFFRGLLLTHSERSMARTLNAISEWGMPLATLMIGFVAYVLMAPWDRTKRVIVSYVVLSFVWGLYVSGMFGMSSNHIFDAIVGLVIATGVAIARIEESTRDSLPTGVAASAAAFAVSLYVFLAIPERLPQARWAHSNAQIREAAIEKDLGVIRQQSGKILCETLALCYWAGRSSDGDTNIIALRKRLLTGEISRNEFQKMMESRHYSMIQLHDRGPTPDTSRLPEFAVDEIRKYYRPVKNEMGGVFLVPR